jgi:hypothetical protein
VVGRPDWAVGDIVDGVGVRRDPKRMNEGLLEADGVDDLEEPGTESGVGYHFE